MNRLFRYLCVFVVFLLGILQSIAATESTRQQSSGAEAGFIDAARFGFSPSASGVENREALQRTVDRGGTIVVSQPGTYKIAGTVFVGSNTSILFGDGVVLQKVDERGKFSHVILNKGALTRTYDSHITIEGLTIAVNGIDFTEHKVFGLRGQLAFFYVKDLKIERFRCFDLGKGQYCIHICTFEDVIVDDVIIKGDKDGVHFGRGKRFTVSNGVFETYDDAIALNAHDYDTGNPELGWIEDGVVQNCHDLADDKKPIGFFCRILAGSWIDWHPGIKVRKSDTVVSNGRLYRVRADADGKEYESFTRPAHEVGAQVLDGITWVMVQKDVTYTAGVRNVVFRDIFLHKPRIGFSLHFDNDRFSRSYYPGALVPRQEQVTFDNIQILHDQTREFLNIATPVDVLKIVNSSFRDNRISFTSNKAISDYQPTRINFMGCVFNHPGEMELLTNEVENKRILLKTSSSVESRDEFKARVIPGKGTITVDSDLTGLRK